MTSSEPRRLRFGVQLQAQRVSWQAFSDALAMVEELGFDDVWNFDHLLPFCGPAAGDAFETLTTLGAMAAMTRRVRFGILVAGVMYRDPATLAKAIATVDHISGGRVIASLGAAWAEREFRTYGLYFPPFKERLERAEETLEILTRLWQEPEVSFDGRYYHLDHAPCDPKPLQRPYPPILVGGAGKGSLRLAARYANIWNVVGTPERCQEGKRYLEEACAKAGRPFDITISAHPQLAVAESREAADRLAAQITESLGQGLDDTQVWVKGNPDQVAEQLSKYVEAGVTHWVLAVTPAHAAQLELFAREVLPRFS